MSHRFFAVIPPGLETALERELINIIKSPESSKIKKETGGVSFSTSLEEGVSLLELLRTPSKLLLRLGTKKLRRMKDIEQLFNNARLNDLLPKETSFSIEVHTHIHTQR